MGASTGLAKGWLLRDGDAVAAVEIARSAKERMRGLLGRASIEGALVLMPCRQVHTLGMRVPLDVAFCDANGTVLRVDTLRTWRMSRVVWRSRFVVEAATGAFERWGIRPGRTLEVKQ